MATLEVPIYLRRGLRANLPSAAPQGEAYYCTDTHELFIGTDTGITLADTDSTSAEAHADAGDAATLAAAEAYTDAHVPTGVELVAHKDQPNGYPSLDGTGHIPIGEIPASLQGALEYQGVWDASANSPALASGVGTKGFFYKVSVAGATTLDGNTNWHVGDLLIFDGSVWDKVDNYEAVTSVAGRTGAVTLVEGDIANLTTDLAAKASTTYVDSHDASTLATAESYTDAETTRAEGAEATLTSAISSEATTRAAADTAETNARTTADSNEATARIAGDALAEKTANKDQAGGYPSLDANGLLTAAETALHFHMHFPYVKGYKLDTIIPLTQCSTSDGVTVNYTVPAGKRAVVDIVGNTAAGPVGSQNAALRVQFGGSGPWYTVTIQQGPLTANSNSSALYLPFSVQCGFIFEPGDVIALLGTSGLEQIWGAIYTFDAVGPLAVKCPRLFSAALLIGDSAVYTVPAGKKAIHISGRMGTAGTESPACVVNTGAMGATGQFLKAWYRVPNGATLDTCLHRMQVPGNALSQNTNELLNAGGFGAMSPGDSIVLSLYGFTRFALTAAANASAGSTVYTGTITGGTSNAFANVWFLVIGFKTAANNGLFKCTASSTTTITLSNASGVAETHGAELAPQKFPLSSVANASAGSTVYTGVFPNGAGNVMQGWNVSIFGFSNGANNGSFKISASTATTITVNNPSGVAETTTAEVDLVSLGPVEAHVANVAEF